MTSCMKQATTSRTTSAGPVCWTSSTTRASAVTATTMSGRTSGRTSCWRPSPTTPTPSAEAIATMAMKNEASSFVTLTTLWRPPCCSTTGRGISSTAVGRTFSTSAISPRRSGTRGGTLPPASTTAGWISVTGKARRTRRRTLGARCGSSTPGDVSTGICLPCGFPGPSTVRS